MNKELEPHVYTKHGPTKNNKKSLLIFALFRPTDHNQRHKMLKTNYFYSVKCCTIFCLTYIFVGLTGPLDEKLKGKQLILIYHRGRKVNKFLVYIYHVPRWALAKNKYH